VHLLENKVLDIVDARCNHEVYFTWLIATSTPTIEMKPTVVSPVQKWLREYAPGHVVDTLSVLLLFIFNSLFTNQWALKG